MPEGHTVHRIARDHQKWFANQKVALCSPQGRFEEEALRLSGKKLLQVSAHGKHLFYHWNRNTYTHVHLGLYGKFRVYKNPAPDPRGAVRVRMIGNERTFDLNGPNCCELINQNEFDTLRLRLGQDPLDPLACAETVWRKFSRSRSAVGTLLLNQSVIAGIGNIYRAEILFLLNIHPSRPAHDLSRSEFDELWAMSVRLLKTGVKYNRIITVERSQTGKPLSKLNRSERLLIYKKTKCPSCGSKVKQWELGSRKIYACSRCQKQ